MHGRANPLMYRKVVGAVFFELVAMVAVVAWKRSYFCETSSLFNDSKMQQFCEASSIFELDNAKNKGILRDFLNF